MKRFSRKQIAIAIIPLLIFSTSCKTQEQIQRNQMVDQMSLQMVQNQKLVAESSLRVSSIQERFAQVNGKIEEAVHLSKEERKTLVSRVLLLEESNKTKTESIKLQDENLLILKKKVDEQEVFIQKVLKTLNSLTKKKSSKKKKKRSKFDQAMYDYSKGRYKKARPTLEKLVDNKRIKGKKKARIVHNLGLISYIQKRNNDAVVYFSQLITDFPSSGYNANGLIYLAKTFKRLKQKDQAKQTLELLISKFPKSKKVVQAKKMLKKLK